MTAPPRLVMTYLVAEAARIYDTTPVDILSKSKLDIHVWPRWAVCYVLRTRWKMRYQYIGAAIGYREHTAACHAVRRAAGRAERDPVFRAKLIELARAEVPGARRYRTGHADHRPLWVPPEIAAMPEYNSQLAA